MVAGEFVVAEVEHADGIPDHAQVATLVAHLRTGNPAAAALLDRLFREAALRFCWGYLGSMEEAEDALQDIWCKVLAAPEVPDRFRPWLYRIARNHCLNVLRNEARRRDGHDLPAPSQIEAILTGHLTRMVKDEARQRVTEIVRDLPASQQEVLRLRYVEGLSRSEVAEVLDLAESVVKSRLFEGLRKLREHASILENL
ncbi:MAG: sigma-70 family RNA polymerase sigma factor [Planctomycetes bacterium]|nr:sigma-70 family RNA polymerase sigma factor [Planctomycetota bacterium]